VASSPFFCQIAEAYFSGLTSVNGNVNTSPERAPVSAFNPLDAAVITEIAARSNRLRHNTLRLSLPNEFISQAPVMIDFDSLSAGDLK